MTRVHASPHRLTASPTPRLTFLPPGEPILLSTRPGFLFVLLYRQGSWLIPPILLIAVHAGLRTVLDPDPTPRLPMLALAWVVAGFLWRIIAWLSRHYVLTERRALVVAGVISRVAGDVPLASIQHTTVTQSALERVFGLGTIGIATAGSGGAAINWLMVPRPHDVLDRIRHASDAAKRSPSPVHRLTVSPPSHPPTIGLSGGIGAGKSEVARILASLGAIVIDSDRAAKEVLNRPDVRDQIVAWWGPSVVGQDGRINRSALAAIIFKDPALRARLESLIHPLVRSHRADAHRLALQHNAPAVVIDSPLLFEAGVDKECDAVIFVDAPRQTRLERLRESRGWDDAELIRREAAQIPAEEKRRRAAFVIQNTGSRDDLARQVEAAFRRILNPS